MGKPLQSFFHSFFCFIILLWVSVATLYSQASSTAPAIQFSAETASINESDGTVMLTIKLLQSNGTAVSVDVVYLRSSGTATRDDIGNYSTKTVSFSAVDKEGATKKVTIVLNNDTNIEGRETAVFQLQNITSGAIVNPQVFSLKINDDDAPKVIINEILYDANADANRDGVVNTGDEFIEIVNISGHSIDVSNWTIWDASVARFTFPEGTVMATNGSVVVFGKAAQRTAYGAAMLFEANTLSLTNGGDTITLKNGDDVVVAAQTYTGAVQNQSITRNPDITGRFIAHSTAAGSVGNYSPGTKTDGTAFGANYATAFRGTNGWRTIASPTKRTTFSDLFSGMPLQGGSNTNNSSRQSNVYFWNEANATFAAITDMSSVLSAGLGYVVYAFGGDKFSTHGKKTDLLRIIKTNQPENNNSVNIPVTATDSDESGSLNGNEGWNMLGNPFGTDISVDGVLAALAEVNREINGHVYIWDYDANSGNGGFKILTRGNGATIAPFQAFWVRYTAIGINSTATFDRSQLLVEKGTASYKPVGDLTNGFKLFLSNGKKYDNYVVKFSPEGSLDIDKLDAFKLFSLNTNSINLFSMGGEDEKIAVNTLPPVNELKRDVYIPLKYQLPGSGTFTLRWEKVDELPRLLNVYLLDHETGSKMDLRKRDEYVFTYSRSKNKPLKLTRKFKINHTSNVVGQARFEIILSADSPQKTQEQVNKPVSLAPNYPNPFRNQTNIEFNLKESNEVSLTVWNIVGQKVATIYDGQTLSAGKHVSMWNAASSLPSGIYILKLETAGKVLVRKMTLIK